MWIGIPLALNWNEAQMNQGGGIMRDLTKWEPFREMERFFNDDFPFLPIIPKPKMGWDMAVDLYEEKGNVVAEMNLPGINPEKLDITVKDGYLKITGFREEEKEKKETNFYYKEIRRGDFDRWVKLPVEVKAEKAEAQYKNGVLKVMIPKKEEAKEEKIKIQLH
jgi:HSP20 family protein